MIPKPSSCRGCPLTGNMQGFVPSDGSGDNGVLVVLEAAGADEETIGKPTVGKAGYFLWQNLKRIGIEREGFRIHNALSCRPPQNKLAGMIYEADAIKHCTPNLDNTIKVHKAHCKEVGKTPVILTLGKIAFRRIMGSEFKPEDEKYDYIAYPLWNERYGCWVLAADHPSFLMRGQTHLLPVLYFVFQRALEIANDGLTLDVADYLMDPNLIQFSDWVDGYFKELERNPDTVLAYDIETPYKHDLDEEDLAKEEDDDFQILMFSFSYKPNSAVSVRAAAELMPLISKVMGSPGPKVGWNNNIFDNPKILHHMYIDGENYDGMMMWHLLNTSLPKGLGFVTPYYVPTTTMWKHLSDSQEFFYSAKDADMTLRNFYGIRQHLKDSGQWEVYFDHVVRVHEVFTYMSLQGVLFDLDGRAAAEKLLSEKLSKIEAIMEEVVPSNVKKLKVYKKKPKKEIPNLFETTAEQNVKACPNCGELKVVAKHFKSIGKKRLKTGEEENKCVGLKSVAAVAQATAWARIEPFKVSKQSLLAYQKAKKHRPIVDRKKGTTTFDEKATLLLVKRYPDDKLYPLILEFRAVQKLLGTYIGTTLPNGRIRGGLPVGFDGRIHTIFTSNPSTLRSASQNPNLQNIPRPDPSDPENPANIVRNLFIAAPGTILLARDYSGIEAKLVGYFASAPDYMRLCAIDVHSFYTAYALNALDGRIATGDLPQLSWSDSDLTACLGGIKKKFKAERNNLYKHLVHAINFGQTARGAQEKILQETGINFEVKTIQYVMDLYKELFPEIPRWHELVLATAEKNGFLKNPFGYVHRFSRPYEYEKDYDGNWTKKQGPDANKCWAFLPQSSAAGIIKEAMSRLYFDRFEEAGQYLRLLIHDELWLEVPELKVDEVEEVLTEEMERPIKAMPLNPNWNQGDYLIVGTEGKRGRSWGSMR